MSQSNREALATELLAALEANRTIEPITSRDPHFDSAAAYQVSAEILRQRRARGEKPIGRKIGFTNRTIWPEYGVFEPIWAHVYDTTVTFLDNPAGRLSIGHLSQPRLEPEIVLHFRSAPSATDGEAELLSHVDWIAHGFEIVQTHFPAWKFKVADTIADFGLHGALIVCPRRPVEHLAALPAALRGFTIMLRGDGTVERHGGGANVLGSPLLAATHLLQLLTQQRQFESIAAGEVVTTGTLLSPPPVSTGQTWTTTLTGVDLPGLKLDLV